MVLLATSNTVWPLGYGTLELVSNPYRYGRNCERGIHPFWLALVSNPYRYGRNAGLDPLQLRLLRVSNPYRYGRNTLEIRTASGSDPSFKPL